MILIADGHVVVTDFHDTGNHPNGPDDEENDTDDFDGFSFHCLVLLAFESSQFVSHVAVLLIVIAAPAVFHAKKKDFFLKVFDAFFSAHLFSLLRFFLYLV